MHSAIRTGYLAQQIVTEAYDAARPVWLDEQANVFRSKCYIPIIESMNRFIAAAEDLETALTDAEAVI